MKSFLNRAASAGGFTLLEVMITLSIMGVVGGMATASMVTARRSMQGDGAMRLVMGQFNIAREMAITQRHNMEVQLVGGNWVRIIRHDGGIATTILASVALESRATFSLTPNVPDTPDTFGNSSGICFGLGCAEQSWMFSTDGSLINGNGIAVNGTVFISIANQPESARAVTVLGTTGRVRGYRWNPANPRTGAAGGWVRV